MIKTIKPKADFLIEVSYEVTIGIGGIYRVLESKARFMKEYYGDNYLLIGLYDSTKSKPEFEEGKIDNPEIERVFKELEKESIKCHYGLWLVKGKPHVILIDISKYWKELKNIDKEIKQDYGLNVKYNFKYYDSFAIWGYAVGKLIEKLLQIKRYKNKKGIVHIHEWVSGLVLLYLKKYECNVSTVFTTHATMLGRSIAIKGENLAKKIKLGLDEGKIAKNSDAKKYKSRFGYNIYNIHLLEKELIKKTDIFTAVSESTSKEAQYILGRKADVILSNGLELSELPSLEERAMIHHNSKEKIHKFLNSYFLPYYSIDTSNSFLFFTSGRYELTTKGYDILFDALAKLNNKLKKEDYPNTIFVFLFIMTENKEANYEILENMAIYNAIEHTVFQESFHTRKNIVSSLTQGSEIKKNMVFDEHFLIESKKLMLRFKEKKNRDPPICAFRGLKKDDIILKLLIKCGLDNKADDKVKVVFYPAPVSVADGLLSMEYREVMSGMHLGIFPSMYEPWGYTPLETAAHGVISVTTDVAGFGKFIQKNSDQRKKPGILVLNTENRKRDSMINELADMMYWVAKLPRKGRVEKKLEAHSLAMSADWKEFAKYYIKAHNLAVEKLKLGKKKKK